MSIVQVPLLQGGIGYLIENYVFRKKTGKNHIQFLRCQMVKKGCKATAKIQNGLAIVTNPDHNHEPPNILGMKFRAAVIDSAKEAFATGATNTDVYNRVREQALREAGSEAEREEILASIPPFTSLVASIHRARLAGPIDKFVISEQDVSEGSPLESGVLDVKQEPQESSTNEVLPSTSTNPLLPHPTLGLLPFPCPEPPPNDSDCQQSGITVDYSDYVEDTLESTENPDNRFDNETPNPANLDDVRAGRKRSASGQLINGCERFPSTGGGNELNQQIGIFPNIPPINCHVTGNARPSRYSTQRELQLVVLRLQKELQVAQKQLVAEQRVAVKLQRDAALSQRKSAQAQEETAVLQREVAKLQKEYLLRKLAKLDSKFE